jgi:hypothetical protein
MAASKNEGSIRTAAFRCVATGEVIETGPFHDILRLPGALDCDLDAWEAGFVDARGRFLDRAQAAAAVGARGRLESRSFFRGEADPTLEAGHLESWRRGDGRRSTPRDEARPALAA